MDLSSDRKVAQLRIAPDRKEDFVWDDAFPGFGIRLLATGSRSWVYRYRFGPKQRNITFRGVGKITAKQARQLANECAFKLGRNIDPQIERRKSREDAAITFGSVSDAYLKAAKKTLRPRSLLEAERYLRIHMKSLRDEPISGIDRGTVVARFENIADENGPVAALRAEATVRAMFNWAIDTGRAHENPIARRKRGKIAPRDRVLSDSELVAIWKACRDDDYGRIVRLLILTGQRRDEIGALRWSEVTTNPIMEARISLPASRTKNNRAHEVPLSPEAVAILLQVNRQENRDWLFGEGRGAFSGWSKAKARLDKRIADAGGVVGPWRLHDLRRTAVTRMADIGVFPHVIETIVNHQSGHKAGIVASYNTSTYAALPRQGLERWSAHVSILVAGESNVVALRAGGRA